MVTSCALGWLCYAMESLRVVSQIETQEKRHCHLCEV